MDTLGSSNAKEPGENRYPDTLAGVFSYGTNGVRAFGGASVLSRAKL